MIRNMAHAVAAAWPRRKLVHPWSYMSRPRVWYWLDAPPLVMPLPLNSSGSPNSCTAPMVETTTVNRIVGLSAGTVTWRNCCHRLAAASSPGCGGAAGVRSGAARGGGGDARPGPGGARVPAAGACGRRGLVEVVGDGLHGGQVDQRVVAGPAPGHDDRDGDLAAQGAGLPVDAVQADALQDGVDQAVVVAEELSEDQRGRGDAGGVGHEHRDPEEGAAPEPVVEQVREAHGDAQLGHRGEDPDGQGVARRVPEELVLQQGGVVAEPHELRAVDVGEPDLVQRDVGGVEERVEAEGAEEQEERGDVGVAPAVAGEPGAAAGGRRGGGW